jgi:hypothetical protein
MRHLAAVLVLVAGVAHAQPMMVNPAQMSGIPRPDPAVPAGTITVRLIRGELSNRVTNHEVELVDASGKLQKQKTNDEGRATFSGLSGGPFKATATLDGNELVSQQIDLPPQVGVRVMLVFPASGPQQGGGSAAGQVSPAGGGGGGGSAATPADGTGVPDKTLGNGVIVIHAQDGDGKPLAGLDVILGHARAGEQGVKEFKGKTDASGDARFEGMDSKTTSGYLAEVLRDGTRFAGKPFRLNENVGARVVIEVRPVSKDIGMIKIAERSHFIVEVNDDAVQVAEILKVQNMGTSAVDIPGGLHIPLPANALSATVGPRSPPNFSATGHEAVWRGPLPPGDTDLQVMFVLAYDSDSIEMVQTTPVPFAEVNVITEKIDGMSVEGMSFTTEESTVQGRKLILYRGKGTPAGGEIRLTITGLPHTSASWRYLAALASVIILIGFGVYAARASMGGRIAGQLEKLEQKRDHLLEELAAFDAKGAADGKRAKKREELVDRLAQVYKEIDEASA